MKKEEKTSDPEENIQNSGAQEVRENSMEQEAAHGEAGMEALGAGHDAMDEAKTCPGGPEKPKSASSSLFLKLALALVLAGGLGLGGFWCYAKIRLGMNASETIAQLDLKIAGMEASQAEIAKTLQGIESRLGQLEKSDRIISEIPAKLNGLEKVLADVRQAVSRVSQGVARMEEGGPIPSVQEGQAPANLGVESAQEQAAIVQETPAPQEEPKVQTKEQVFENFLKSLLTSIGRGLKWSAEKLFFVVDEILKRVF
ncbi:MAG: hypothetical protein HZA01_11705 [Nitrospinae bacterium]|nr:hypothetical protein [Nitrospinota bacterium]